MQGPFYVGRDLGRIRTPDLQNRNLTFYPAELLGRKRMQR